MSTVSTVPVVDTSTGRSVDAGGEFLLLARHLRFFRRSESRLFSCRASTGPVDMEVDG